MKTIHTLPMAAALLLLAACSKPAETTTAAADNAAAETGMAADNAAGAATDAAANATAAGGAVSPPQGNDAINSDLNKTQSDTVAASNSFTEGQARGHIEKAGYSDVTGLMKTPEGVWTAKANKGGKSVNVSVDFKGAVTTH